MRKEHDIPTVELRQSFLTIDDSIERGCITSQLKKLVDANWVAFIDESSNGLNSERFDFHIFLGHVEDVATAGTPPESDLFVELYQFWARRADVDRHRPASVDS